MLDLLRCRSGGAPSLLEKAFAALIPVTDNAARCGAAGGVEVVLEVLRRHKDSPDAAELLTQACWALRNITVNADNKARCGAAGGVEVVLDILRRHNEGGPAAAALLEQACRALHNITINAANLRKCRAANGQAVVREVRGRHSTDAVICSTCNHIL